MKGMRPLSERELKKILDYPLGTYHHRNKAMILLGVGTGLRISEILSLKVNDVLFSGRVRDEIYIKKKNTKTKANGLRILLPDYVKKLLSDYLETIHYSVDLPLFKSRKGNQAITKQQANYIIKDLLYRLGFDVKQVGTHSLRKTFAKKVYDTFQGDYFKCQKALNHKSLNSTVSYIPIEEEKLKSEIAKLPLFS